MRNVVCGLLILSLFPIWVGAKEKINFNQDIRPILSDRCFHCHGPDAHDRKKKLRLDLAQGDDGAYRVRKGVAGIKPGSLKESSVWQRIITDDEDDVMPPTDAHKKPLTPEEKELIKRWIEEGAEYQDFWAFVPPKSPAVPKVKDSTWSQHPIDQFALRKMERHDLKYSKEADKRSLIRRVTFDLTGLPPTRQEIHNFLNDKSQNAYEKLVDRLLASKQYGEHMTKYWLDLVRFADTNGRHHDQYREMTPYRDWVIRSFNDNLSYDDFVRYQVAGDLYEKPSTDQLVASGFNRLHLIIDVGTALPEESYTKNVIDRVTAVGTAFMGLTVQCAICHDHKYDPISQKDFFALFAFFNNFDGKPETGRRSGFDFEQGLQKPYIFLGKEADKAKLLKMIADYDTLNKKKSGLRNKLKKEKDKTKKDEYKQALQDVEKSLKKFKSGINSFKANVPAAMVMKEAKEIRKSYILKRGEYDQLGDVVERNTPEFLPPLNKKNDLATRMDFANWLIDSNPLTARIAVNRFWQQLFGTGLVKTSEDFGAQGEVPSHPDLLNHLTVFFQDSGWDVKAFMKYILTSKTYRQSSVATKEEFEADAENRLLSRGSRFRMDSEMIRDQTLATSGLLSTKMYGKSVKPPQPDGLWKAVTLPSSYPKIYRADTGDAVYRRSLYTFWKRGMAPPQMTILNAPDREACIARRERTNTPLQALLLMNEKEYMKAARNLAKKTLSQTYLSDAKRLTVVYETVTSKLPDTEETKVLLKLIDDLKLMYSKNPQDAKALCGEDKQSSSEKNSELAAWTMLVNSLYNLDIVKTRE
ncbi:MAG: PSD1 and planctomycete cytochrome C domain-containing protein [Lentisphaeraceae bacterium]|nr:PSD1 and planctomycete cytochrome C domain-containing protein [Lentisphaeraceae bacterium]